jgi:hypothetical protein
MIEISSLAALIFGEILVGLIVLSGLLLLFTLLRKQRIRKSANRLAERVQNDKEKRSERLKSLLAERYGLQSPQLDQTLHNIMQMEMTLYQNMLNGYLKDDQIYLQQIDVDVENLVLSYQSLGGMVSGGDNHTAGDGEEVEALKTENARLAEELKVTMDTMGRMLNEYSTMFADGDEGFPGSAGATKESGAQAEPSPAAPEVAAIEEMPASEPFKADQAEEKAKDEVVIPDMTEEELSESSLLEEATEDSEPEPSVEMADDVDEEVSEIIDEVMEIADDMIHENDSSIVEPVTDSEPESTAEPLTESTSETEQIGESMVDDINSIDIEIPEVESTEVEQSEFVPGSLEEEWAKLLEEEASDEEKKDS